MHPRRNRQPRLSRLSALWTVLLGFLLSACGDPGVQVTNTSYEPRLVIEGLLLPDHPVRNIHIARNFRVDEDLSQTPLLLPQAEAVIIDEESGQHFELTFTPFDHPQGTAPDFYKSYFAYEGVAELTIRHGASYSIEVSALVEGEELFARATTTVPERGFRIDDLSHERFRYRERGADGEVIVPEIAIQRSPGTDFYVKTVVPLEPTVDSFIFDNPFTDEKANDLDLTDFDYRVEWIQNTPATPGLSSMRVFWWDVWFYGRHEIVIYAADANYAAFMQTFFEVQEPDGNFHEPVFSIEGDGIGYFGSAIADTVYVEVLRD